MKATDNDHAVLASPAGNTPLLTLVWLKSDDRRDDDARGIVGSMLAHTVGPYGSRAVVGGDASLAWGVLLPDEATPLTCWSIDAGGDLCLFEGEMYDDPPGMKLAAGEDPRIAGYLAARMRRDPWQPLAELNGMFSGVYVDSGRSHAHAFVDASGTRPLFWFSDERCFIVTNNLWAFRGCDAVARTCDPMTLTQMLTIGFPLGGRTWIDGVKQLQPGGRVCSSADGRTTVRCVNTPVERHTWNFTKTVSVLREAMDETISRMCGRLGGAPVLGLSGGLDSRICLASLHTQGLAHHNLTFCGSPGEADLTLAASASAMLHEAHRPVILDSPTALSLYRDLRIMNEGESPGFGFFFLGAAARRHGDGLIIGSEAVRDTPLGSSPVWTMKGVPDLARGVLAGQMDRFAPRQACEILEPSWRVPWQDVLDEWRASFAGIPRQSLMDIYLDHQLAYRVQRRARLRLDISRWFCQPLYPYMDGRLYAAFRSIPLEHLRCERAHLALLSDYGSGLERLPNAARHQAKIPIQREYDLRRLVQLARLIRQEVLMPLDVTLMKAKGMCGMGKNLAQIVEGEGDAIRNCGFFDARAVERLTARAARGVFPNSTALHSLASAVVVHDFLFGAGLSGERGLRFLNPRREVEIMPWKGTVPRGCAASRTRAASQEGRPKECAASAAARSTREEI